MLSGLSKIASLGRATASAVARNSTLHCRPMTTSAAYQAGLWNPSFTTELDINNETPSIPIYRVLKTDGTLEDGCSASLTREESIEAYKFMKRLLVYDEYLYNIQRQGRISFYMQNHGEEGLQYGIGKALSIEDTLWCQYRELGVLMARGFTLTNALDQLFSNEGDPGKGRQMPISYTKQEANIVTISTPLSNQIPQAVGGGYAQKLLGKNSCAVGFFGEGAASEGDIHAAMNFAAVLKSPTIFICRNNGYAISTHVSDQYVGDGIAPRAIGYGMHKIRVDGNDVFAVYNATQKAREICVEDSVPVLIEGITYRLGHHSTSDDAAQYRIPNESKAWEVEGVTAIGRLKKYLMQNDYWTEAEDIELGKEAKNTVLSEIRAAEKRKRVAIVPGMFDDVYSEKPWNLVEQEQEFKEFLKANASKYDVSQFRQ